MALRNGRGMVNGCAIGPDTYLPSADLRGADLKGAMLMDADMYDADLAGASLQDANFTGANLRGANFTGANLTGTILEGADLVGAIFSKATVGPDNSDLIVQAIQFKADLEVQSLKHSRRTPNPRPHGPLGRYGR